MSSTSAALRDVIEYRQSARVVVGLAFGGLRPCPECRIASCTLRKVGVSSSSIPRAPTGAVLVLIVTDAATRKIGDPSLSWTVVEDEDVSALMAPASVSRSVGST